MPSSVISKPTLRERAMGGWSAIKNHLGLILAIDTLDEGDSCVRRLVPLYRLLDEFFTLPSAYSS